VTSIGTQYACLPSKFQPKHAAHTFFQRRPTRQWTSVAAATKVATDSPLLTRPELPSFRVGRIPAKKTDLLLFTHAFDAAQQKEIVDKSKAKKGASVDRLYYRNRRLAFSSHKKVIAVGRRKTKETGVGSAFLEKRSTLKSRPTMIGGNGDGGLLLPVTPNNKDQRAQQHSSPDDHEIEALRQRGLAKLLNKHFTETTKKLAAEKAAADAALRDLEARKKMAAASVPSNGGTGGAGEGLEAGGISGINDPAGGEPLDSLYASVHQWRNECRRKERETLLLYQRYVNKFGASGQIKLPPSSPSGKEGAAAPTSPDGTARPGVPPPAESPHRGRNNDSPPSVLVPTSRVPQSRQQQKQQKQKHELQHFDSADETVPSPGDKELRNYYRRQLEQQNQHRGGTKKIFDDEPIDVTRPNAYFDPFSMPTLLGGHTGGDDDDADDDEEDNDDDIDDISMISGLTSVNSAMTRQILHDCEHTVVTFLQEEKKAIRRLMDRETTTTTTTMGEADTDGCSQSHKTTPSALGSIQSHAAQEAENMAKKMQEILSDFTKKEQKDKSLASTKEGRPYETSNPDESWAVYYDESYQREYYHEANTNKTQWEPPEQDGTNSSSSTSTGGEGGGAAAGDSSRGVLDISSNNKNSIYHKSASPVLESIDVMPEVQERVSRIAVYRRKRRRLRKRRLLGAVLAVLFMAAFGLYRLLSAHPEMAQGWKQRFFGTLDSLLATDLAGTKTKVSVCDGCL
jgi:WW domain